VASEATLEPPTLHLLTQSAEPDVGHCHRGQVPLRRPDGARVEVAQHRTVRSGDDVAQMRITVHYRGGSAKCSSVTAMASSALRRSRKSRSAGAIVVVCRIRLSKSVSGCLLGGQDSKIAG
jgi:hypothetical protein